MKVLLKSLWYSFSRCSTIICHELEQQEKIKVTTNNLEFAHLAMLILIDGLYTEQFLCRTHLPCLVKLAIDNDILLAIINQAQQQAKDNCSRVKTLRTVRPANDSVDTFLKFFSPDAYVEHSNKE